MATEVYLAVHVKAASGMALHQLIANGIKTAVEAANEAGISIGITIDNRARHCHTHYLWVHKENNE